MNERKKVYITRRGFKGVSVSVGDGWDKPGVQPHALKRARPPIAIMRKKMKAPLQVGSAFVHCVDVDVCPYACT